MSKEFNEQAIAAALLNFVDEGETLEDISYNAFNLDCWILGTYQAAQALAEFDEEDQQYTDTMLNGVFGAIEYVQTFEDNEIGERVTDCSDPEKLADVVAYINGNELINNLMDEFNLDIDDELTEKQANEITEYLENIVNNH